MCKVMQRLPVDGKLSIKLYKKPSVSGTQGSVDTRGKGLMEVG